MISNFLTLLFDTTEEFFGFLASWKIFGDVSLIHFIILFAITSMIVNVFVGRGKS